MKSLAAIALAFTGMVHAAIAPVPNTLRARGDGWERDMLFVVSNEPDVEDGYVRFAVVGCAQQKGYVVAVEIDDEQVEDGIPIEWVAGGDERAAIVANIMCGGDFVGQF